MAILIMLRLCSRQVHVCMYVCVLSVCVLSVCVQTCLYDPMLFVLASSMHVTQLPTKQRNINIAGKDKKEIFFNKGISWLRVSKTCNCMISNTYMQLYEYLHALYFFNHF